MQASTSIDKTRSLSVGNALHGRTETSAPLQLQDASRFQTQDNKEQETLTAAQQQTGAGLSASRRPPSTIILHYSPLKAAWDWLILLLVIYVAVSTPYVAAFLSAKRYQNSGPLGRVDLAVDVLFMADVIINFRTSFVQHGEVIVDAKLIAVHYLRGWFVIDAVSAIPFDFVLSMTGAGDVCTIAAVFNNSSASRR